MRWLVIFVILTLSIPFMHAGVNYAPCDNACTVDGPALDCPEDQIIDATLSCNKKLITCENGGFLRVNSIVGGKIYVEDPDCVATQCRSLVLKTTDTFVDNVVYSVDHTNDCNSLLNEFCADFDWKSCPPPEPEPKPDCNSSYTDNAGDVHVYNKCEINETAFSDLCSVYQGQPESNETNTNICTFSDNDAQSKFVACLKGSCEDDSTPVIPAPSIPSIPRSYESVPISSSPTTYPTCTYCSMLDQAWYEAGNSQVYVPGTGLVAYTTVYPPVKTSTGTSSSLSSSTSISSVSGKAVYGASTTCTQTQSTLFKGQQDNERLNKYASEWSNALQKVGLVGTTWIGVMNHNGKTDDTGLSVPGRLTIIFAPCTTNFNNPIEVMYYWHGIKGFGYNTVEVPCDSCKSKKTTVTFNDFNERMAPQSKALSDNGRNFVLIFPEMPWSGGDQQKYSSRNTDSRSKAVFNGEDNAVSMHNEALGYIATNMGNPTVSLTSIVGHSKGGHPLRIAADNGQLAQLAPGKITLSDADYWDSSRAVWNNYVKSHNNVELNLIAQHQDNGGAHQPTYWTIDFLKSLDDAVTSSWTLSGYETRKNPTASTPGATRGQVYTVSKYPNINYYPHEGSHSAIGKMSLSFVGPTRSVVTNIGDCPISAGQSSSIGSPSTGRMTGSVPILSSSYLSSFSVNDEGIGHHWGTVELVNMLEKSACDVYPYTNTKLTVQDLSKPNGGDIKGHASHNSGRDADTGIYYYENGKLSNLNTRGLCESGNCNDKGLCQCVTKPTEKFMHPTALEANYRFIKSMNARANVKQIGFDKKLIEALSNYAQTTYGEQNFARDNHLVHWINHWHHYHIRIECPQGDGECTG